MMRTLLLALLVWDCTAKTCLLDHGYSDTGCASGTGVDMDITGYASGEASTISMGVMNITTTWTCLGNGNATEVEAINAMPPTTKTFVADGACVATTMGMTSSTYTCGDCALAKKVLPDQWYVCEVVLPHPHPFNCVVALGNPTWADSGLCEGWVSCMHCYPLDLSAPIAFAQQCSLPWRSSTDFQFLSLSARSPSPRPNSYGPELICNLALAKDGLASLMKCDAAAKAKLATYKSCAKTCANPKTANMCGTTSGAARAGVAPTSLMVVVLAVAMYR